MFGLRREILEGKATEPSEVLAELDKVTADDVLRVGRDLMRDEALRLAVIGPFDDAGRFESLLDGKPARPAKKGKGKTAATLKSKGKAERKSKRKS